MSISDQALELSARIKPLLAVQPAAVQGAALADLLSIWLVGHRVAGRSGKYDAEATLKIRKTLLNLHMEVVRRLVAEAAE